MAMTKEMSKHKRRTAKEEEKVHAEARQVVVAALVVKDKEILDANQVGVHHIFFKSKSSLLIIETIDDNRRRKMCRRKRSPTKWNVCTRTTW